MDLKFGLHNVVPISNAPHWSAMRGKYGAPAPTGGLVDYLSLLPVDSGFLGNESIGDCFFAAQYHRRQAATAQLTGTMVTEPDSVVLGAYCAATGCVINSDGTATGDNGTDPNQGFNWLSAHGLPTASGTPITLYGAFELDPRNYADCLTALDYCIGLPIGIRVPNSIAQAATPPQIWDFAPGDSFSDEGHEILVLRGDPTWNNLGILSWGLKFTMTRRFWDAAVNQVTATVYADEFSAGRNPFNMTVDQMDAEMAPLRAGAIP
jgi:hypothetical protein